MNDIYQKEVAGVIDYNLRDTPYGFRMRGPYKADGTWIRNAISFIGAAQTFGHFVNTPFPTLVSEAFSANPFNAGVSGAGPDLFTLNERLIDDINQTKLCVIQVMSGRSIHNRYFRTNVGASIGTLHLKDIKKENIQGHDAFAILRQELSQSELEEVVLETIENYTNAYRALCDKIKVTKVLLWISTREPKYDRDFRYTNSFLGEFPHLVDDVTLAKISTYCDATVHVQSRLGIGRPLWDSEKGEPYVVDRSWGRIDAYSPMYSDPYLHLTAAASLVTKIHELDVI